MNRFLLNALTVSAILSVPSFVQGQETHVAILIDGTGSYALMHDETLAQRIVRDAINRLPAFGMRDRITVAPIGDYSAHNPITEAQVSRRFPPDGVAQAVRQLLLTFPDMIRSIGEPTSTNIVGALERMSRRIDCGASEGHLLVLTDGIETGQSMTLPNSPIFEGCASFTMIGVMGQTPAQTQELGDFWMQWCAQAGFSRCDWLS